MSAFPLEDANPKPKSSKAPATVLAAHVQRIVKKVTAFRPETVEICFPSAQPLYQEIRIENRFVDREGQEIALQEGDRLRITIEVESRDAD